MKDERDNGNEELNDYKAYYEASQRGDEWSGLDMEEISNRIRSRREVDSWNNMGGS